MSVAPYSNNSTRTRTPSSRRLPKTTNRLNQAIANKVVQFPKARTEELKSILRLEKISLFIMLSLMLTTLGMYASAVYAPKLWSENYKKLGKLQSDERDLVTNNETLKNSLANEAKNPAEGLTDVQAFQSIFLPTIEETQPQIGNRQAQQRNTPKEEEEPITPVSY